jgi:hypothetical protein
LSPPDKLDDRTVKIAEGIPVTTVAAQRGY